MKKWLQEIRLKRQNNKRYQKVLKEIKNKNELEAVEKLTQFISEETTRPEYKAEAYLNIAHIYERTGQLHHAVKFFDTAFETARHLKFNYVKEIDEIFEHFRLAERFDLYEKWRLEFTKRAEIEKSFRKFNVPSIYE